MSRSACLTSSSECRCRAPYIAGRATEIGTALLLAVALAGPVLAQSDAARRIRVTVLDGKASDGAPPREAGLYALLSKSKRFEVRRAPLARLTRESARWPEVFVIEDALPDGDDATRAALTTSLIPAIASGVGLVITGDGVGTLESSSAWDGLVGRKPIEKSKDAGPPAKSAKTAGLIVAVLDQRHGVTQSLPHFIHDGAIPRIDPTSRTRVVAGAVAFDKTLPALTTPRPIVWSHAVGRGRVFVTALEHRSGRSASIAKDLALRGVEWASGDLVTLPFASHGDGKYRLLAEMLDATHEGMFEDHGPMPGFFRGREIARYMTYHGASWLTRDKREIEERPERVLDSLGIEKGQTVCDFGAGNGYFSLRLARRVGATGRVLAVDIQKEMLALLDRRAREKGITNVELILGEERDPKLPENALDLVLMVDVYHELSAPAAVLRHVRRALRPKGRIVLVEYRGEDPTVRIKPRHRILERQAIAELEAQGFKWIETKDFVPSQHVLIFGLGRGKRGGGD